MTTHRAGPQPDPARKIDIIRSGRLNSVQDLGRTGYRHLGVCQQKEDQHAQRC